MPFSCICLYIIVFFPCVYSKPVLPFCELFPNFSMSIAFFPSQMIAAQSPLKEPQTVRATRETPISSSVLCPSSHSANAQVTCIPTVHSLSAFHSGEFMKIQTMPTWGSTLNSPSSFPKVADDYTLPKHPYPSSTTVVLISEETAYFSVLRCLQTQWSLGSYLGGRHKALGLFGLTAENGLWFGSSETTEEVLILNL